MFRTGRTTATFLVYDGEALLARIDAENKESALRFAVRLYGDDVTVKREVSK